MEGSLCRLCLQKLVDDYFEIFPKKSEGEHENVIPMRLAAVAAIEVIQFDALPKKICRSCRYQLELSYSFRKKSQISDAKLRKHYKLLSLGKTTILNIEEDNEDFEMFGDSLQDSRRFLEDFERLRDENLKSQLRIELETETQERLKQLKIELRKELSSTLRCEIAKEIREEVRNNERLKIEAKVKLQLQSEMLEKCRREESKAILSDLEEFLRIKRSERNKVSTILLLEGADSQTETFEELKEDDMESIDRSRIEKESSSELKTQQRKKDHLINSQVQHSKSSCNEVMSYQIRINKDIEMCESDDTVVEKMEDVAVFNCDEIDDEVSKDQDDVLEILKVLSYDSEDADNPKQSSNDTDKTGNQIKKTHSNKKSSTVTYVCVDPSNKPSISRPTKTPKIFKCKLCPVEVSTECSLQRHLRVHINGDKSVTCPECKIVVSCSSALKRHMVIHTGRRPYVCSECNKAFGQKEILKRHENSQHRGLRRHKCPHCVREFSQKINLTQHIEQQHLGKPRKRYKCHLCTKSFFFSSGLSRHLNYHSGITYQCIECVRTFTDRSSIKRHVLKVHGVERVEEMMTEIDKSVKN